MADDEAPTSAPPKGLHYAWNSDTAKRAAELASLGVDTTPKAVTTSTAAVAGIASPLPQQASAWNAAGTWEERDVTARAQALLRERLQVPLSVSGQRSVVSVAYTSG